MFNVLKNFLAIYQKKIAGGLSASLKTGAAILTATTFASYVLGLLRDRLLAQTFGAGRELDIFNAAFIIPDLLLNIFISGALAAAFIPVFTQLISQKNEKEAFETANSIISSGIIVLLALGSLIFIFADYFAIIVAPGFDEAGRETLVKTMRLLLLSPLIFTFSNALGGMLIGYKSFFAYGLSPVFYNFGIIGGIFLSPFLGIFGPVLGTLAGALLHLGVRIAGILKHNFRYRFAVNFKNQSFRQIIRLMIPKMIGQPTEQLNFWIFAVIASSLSAGSIAILNLARNFQSVPVSLFGIAFSLAAFPALSQAAGKKNKEDYLKILFKTLKNILLFTVLSALFIYLFGEFFIRLFFGGGKFSEQNIRLTAQTLAVFSLAIPTEGAIHLLARSFYSLKNTLTPVLISVAGLIIAAFAGWTLTPNFGLSALPFAFFLGSFSEVILLSILLKRKISKEF